MADTLTDTLRLTQPTVGGDSATWGGLLNSNWSYVDEAVNQIIGIDIAGEAAYSLTADGSSSDQARYAGYEFTGALTGACTIALPANPKIGWAINDTSGGHNVVLQVGTVAAGTTVALANDDWALVACDGTNVSLPDVEFGGINCGVPPSGAGRVNIAQESTSATALTVNGIADATAGLMAMTVQVATNFIGFNTSIGVGSISTNGNATAYNTTSDARLKEGAGLIEDAGAILDGLKARWFKWKSAAEKGLHAGFFAQELHKVWPHAVTQGSGEPGDADFHPWQADLSKIVPLLVAALQEARRELHALKARVEDLEGGGANRG